MLNTVRNEGVVSTKVMVPVGAFPPDRVAEAATVGDEASSWMTGGLATTGRLVTVTAGLGAAGPRPMAPPPRAGPAPAPPIRGAARRASRGPHRTRAPPPRPP